MTNTHSGMDFYFDKSKCEFIINDDEKKMATTKTKTVMKKKHDQRLNGSFIEMKL